MTFTSLASSSRGNAYVVSDGETTLLLECGLSFRELQKRLGYGVLTGMQETEIESIELLEK